MTRGNAEAAAPQETQARCSQPCNLPRWWAESDGAIRQRSCLKTHAERLRRAARGGLPHLARAVFGAISGMGSSWLLSAKAAAIADMVWRRQLTRSRHRAEAFQIEAQAGPGSGIPPAKMSQRVSLSDGEGLLPSLCSDEPRAERTDQRVRQRSTHRVRDFVFARFAERPVFARPTETSCRIKQRATY
jgi:hypothetical protein